VSPPEVLLVSLGSTGGLRTADEQLRSALELAGARVELVSVPAPRRLRTLMLTDLAWAMAARRASGRALGAPAGTSGSPGAPSMRCAVIYSSTTAALLWPAAGAIRFDATAAGNRPGRHGLWQRPLERRRLREAPLLLPWSPGALAEAGLAGAPAQGRALVVPVAVEPSGGPGGERDVAAVTYGANPSKKGLDRVLRAWAALRARGEQGGEPLQGELLVAGLEREGLERVAGRELPLEGVRAVGTLPREQYRALLRRARVFVCAPRREDYGLAQLEALADGCMLVTTPAPGPYAALALARALDQRLVGEDLVGALRAALEQPLPGYGARAQAALSPYRMQALDRLVSEQLLARLLGQSAQL
jgi:glycosyltransferase involved in cell wall biosynthesis